MNAERVVQGAASGSIPITDLENHVFNTGAAATYPLRTALPFFILYNADSSAHTMTGNGRASDDIAPANIPFSVPAGGYLPIPTAAFASIADGNPNGNVYGFYSDVPIQGFNPPAAAGTPATTVVHDFAGTNVTPNADTTEQMGGLGTTLTIKPLVSGKVQVQINCGLKADATSDEVYVKISHGTGAAPNLYTAATGIESQTLVSISSQVAAGVVTIVNGVALLTISGLTVNTTYWFDLVSYITALGDTVYVYNASVSELPA